MNFLELTRKQANREFDRLLAEGRDAGAPLRVFERLGRSSLFFLLTRLLDRRDADNDWCWKRCREVQENPDGRLDLWAREHYKSTIITFGLTIFDILRDPETTIGIFSHTRPIAKGFLRQIKLEFERNDLLKQVYPDVLWKNSRSEAPKWSEDDGIVVRRKNNPKEATLEAWGLVDGQPTSKHFRVLLYDDIVTEKSVTTPDQMRKTTSQWELSLCLGSDGGSERYVGTRYHAGDTYGTMIKRGSAVVRCYPATEDGTPGGKTVLRSREWLDKKRRDFGPYNFGCQILLDPVADKVQGFREEWMRYYTPRPNDWREWNLYLLCDPAGDKKQGSDYTVMLVIGLAPDNNYYVVDGVRDRLNLTERTETFIRLHRKYKPVASGYEKYGKDADIEHLEYVMDQENYRFEVLPLGGKVTKNDRIRKLVPVFERKRFRWPSHLHFIDYLGETRDLTREFVEDEFLRFPVSSHDDILDCAARILDPALCAAFPDEEAESWHGPVCAHTDYDLFGEEHG